MIDLLFSNRDCVLKTGVVTVDTYIKTIPENIYAENCTYSSVSVNIYSGRELRGQKTPFLIRKKYTGINKEI